jgi:outer membrane protein, multidrug efflux system
MQTFGVRFSSLASLASLAFLGFLGFLVGSLLSCSSVLNTPIAEAKPAESIPMTWKEAEKGNHGEISTAWLQEFSSPQMSQLVMEALANNPSLKASEARLRASRETVAVTEAKLKPSIEGGANTSRRRSDSFDEPTTYRSSSGLSSNLSWELDLWGRIRDEIEINQSSYRSSGLEFRNARLSLAANTAKAYCNLITSEQQVELARKTLNSFEQNNRIVERNYKAGIPGTRSLAVQLSRSNLASSRSTLRDRQLRRNNAARALEILLGRYPSAELKTSSTLPVIQRDVPTGIPSEILLRRPDVALAQEAVYVSAKRVDIAKKNLLPAVRLTGGLTSSDESWSNIFNMNNLIANAAANLSQTFYDGGELKAEAKEALELNKASIHSFANVAFRALDEVEKAIATDTALREQEAFLLVQTKSSDLAETQAARDYSEGIEGVGILEILESQREANNARASLINIRNQRLQNRIDLHLALGGDFSTTIP